MCHHLEAVVRHLVFRTTISVKGNSIDSFGGGLGKRAEMILELMLTLREKERRKNKIEKEGTRAVRR